MKIYVITKFSPWEERNDNVLICADEKTVIDYVMGVDEITSDYYCCVVDKYGKQLDDGYLFKTRKTGKLDLS